MPNITWSIVMAQTTRNSLNWEHILVPSWPVFQDIVVISYAIFSVIFNNTAYCLNMTRIVWRYTYCVNLLNLFKWLFNYDDLFKEKSEWGLVHLLYSTSLSDLKSKANLLLFWMGEVLWIKLLACHNGAIFFLILFKLRQIGA